ncbi:YppG family protein [Oceanobacillus sp. FSL K6-2867]|uniref:YppG family protein n=1 Tax=Oceanobacillus sp. FSL K6-2867 TaxID=2954748 RepID=UPI0030DD72BB
MRYRPYNQPQYSPPVNHNLYPYHTSYSHQNWNGAELHQTPYDLFAKPELPSQWSNQDHANMDFAESASNPNLNPNGNPGDPEPNFNPNMNANQGQQAAGPMSYFQNGNGQLDFDKIISTVGQIASTYHQVSPIVQQFSSLIKNIR